VSQKRPALFRGRHFQDVIIFVRALVSALLAQLPRLGGNDGIARSDRGSRHHLALGPALRAHFESAPWERTASESILAGGRNLRASHGKLGVPVSRRGFGWGHHPFRVVAQPGSGCRQALLAVGLASNWARPSTGDQRRRPSSVCHSDIGIGWLAKGDVVGQIQFIHQVYGIAA
jgi:hypothetical protein